MARRSVLFGCLALVLGMVVPGSAQQSRSDFDGVWLSKSGKLRMTVRTSDREFRAAGNGQELVYPTTGARVTVAAPKGGQRQASAAWEGDRLVVRTELRTGGRRVLETWELVDPDTLKLSRRFWLAKKGRWSAERHRTFRKVAQ